MSKSAIGLEGCGPAGGGWAAVRPAISRFAPSPSSGQAHPQVRRSLRRQKRLHGETTGAIMGAFVEEPHMTDKDMPYREWPWPFKFMFWFILVGGAVNLLYYLKFGTWGAP